jgi:opacity protein-like surface antigen
MKKAIVVLALFGFCMLPSQNAWSKSNIGLTRLGGDIGMVDPESSESTLGFGAVADLGTLSPRVRLTSQLGYWSKSESAFGTEASVRDISLGARAVYEFPVSSKLQPYMGGGLGLHFFHSEITMPDIDLGGGMILPGFTAEDSATKLGIDLGGGASTPLSERTNLFGEFWYTAADIDQISLKAGLSFQLSR